MIKSRIVLVPNELSEGNIEVFQNNKGPYGYSKINQSQTICQIEGCVDKVKNKDKLLCEEHFAKWKKRNRICLFDGCLTYASYGPKENWRKIMCARHRTPDMISKRSVSCEVLGCNKSSCYGVRGELATRCTSHKLESMIDLKHKSCNIDNCNKRASFGLENEPVTRCSIHATDAMKTKDKRRCELADCNKSPCYGIEGFPAVRCKSHMETGMINVKSKRCEFIGCRKIPSYGIGSKRLRCKEHATDEMYPTDKRVCEFPGCKTRSSYGSNGILSRCRKHILNGMKDMANEICDIEGCNTTASFGSDKDGKEIRCKRHATDEMICVRAKICEFPNCRTRASFGPLFSKPRHCKKHSSYNEYKLRYPKCNFPDCKIIPCYTDKLKNYPEYCEVHKSKDHINILERKCSLCSLMWYIPEDRTICNDCYSFTFRRIHKSKEEYIGKILVNNSYFPISHDKPISNLCSKYRPDYILDYDSFLVIVEVDENQHKSYNCECEQMRMIQLFQDAGGIPMIFIRYNPDEYINRIGEKIRSNIGREKTLLKILSLLHNLSGVQTLLSVYYLFYDGWDGNFDKYDIDITRHISRKSRIRVI